MNYVAIEFAWIVKFKISFVFQCLPAQCQAVSHRLCNAHVYCWQFYFFNLSISYALRVRSSPYQRWSVRTISMFFSWIYGAIKIAGTNKNNIINRKWMHLYWVITDIIKPKMGECIKWMSASERQLLIYELNTNIGFPFEFYICSCLRCKPHTCTELSIWNLNPSLWIGISLRKK